MSKLKSIDPPKRVSHSRNKFALGHVLITPGVRSALMIEEILEAIQRHRAGDWGEVSEIDREENELSIRGGFHLFSIYLSSEGTSFWVITEADRSSDRKS